MMGNGWSDGEFDDNAGNAGPAVRSSNSINFHGDDEEAGLESTGQTPLTHIPRTGGYVANCFAGLQEYYEQSSVLRSVINTTYGLTASASEAFFALFFWRPTVIALATIGAADDPERFSALAESSYIMLSGQILASLDSVAGFTAGGFPIDSMRDLLASITGYKLKTNDNDNDNDNESENENKDSNQNSSQPQEDVPKFVKAEGGPDTSGCIENTLRYTNWGLLMPTMLIGACSAWIGFANLAEQKDWPPAVGHAVGITVAALGQFMLYLATVNKRISSSAKNMHTLAGEMFCHGHEYPEIWFSLLTGALSRFLRFRYAGSELATFLMAAANADANSITNRHIATSVGAFAGLGGAWLNITSAGVDDFAKTVIARAEQAVVKLLEQCSNATLNNFIYNLKNGGLKKAKKEASIDITQLAIRELRRANNAEAADMIEYCDSAQIIERAVVLLNDMRERPDLSVEDAGRMAHCGSASWFCASHLFRGLANGFFIKPISDTYSWGKNVVADFKIDDKRKRKCTQGVARLSSGILAFSFLASRVVLSAGLFFTFVEEIEKVNGNPDANAQAAQLTPWATAIGLVTFPAVYQFVGFQVDQMRGFIYGIGNLVTSSCCRQRAPQERRSLQEGGSSVGYGATGTTRTTTNPLNNAPIAGNDSGAYAALPGADRPRSPQAAAVERAVKNNPDDTANTTSRGRGISLCAWLCACFTGGGTAEEEAPAMTG